MSSFQWLWWTVAGLAATFILSLFAAYTWAISPEYASASAARLPYSPNQVSTRELFRLIFVLVARSAVPGLAPPLQPSGEQSTGTFQLPKIALSGKLDLTEEKVELFNQAMREEASGAATVNPLFLFTQVGSLAILLLAHRQCPIKPLGSVNTRNTFRFIHPRLCCDIKALQQLSREGILSYTARMGDEPAVRRKRGVELSLTIEIFDSGTLLLRMSISMLQFLPSSFEPRYVAPQDEKPEASASIAPDTGLQQILKLTPADPKRWAASCKDYNPIHVSALGARLFGGFPQVIAHGNHVVAFALQQQNGKKAGSLFNGDRPLDLTSQFLRPVALPAELNCLWSSKSSTVEEFAVRSSNGKDLVQGAVTVLDHAKA